LRVYRTPGWGNIILSNRELETERGRVRLPGLEVLHVLGPKQNIVTVNEAVRREVFNRGPVGEAKEGET
jgi:hypothetical protein